MNTQEFTQEQQAILRLIEGQHIVLAPPGSGKTQLLSQRVIDALLKNIDPASMLCITFTNRAAKNMNERIGELGNKQPFIGTLHKFGYQFLLANQLIPASTALLDEEDAHQILTEAVTAAKENLGQKHAEVKIFEAASYIRDFNQAVLRLKSGIEKNSQSTLLEEIAKKYNLIKKSCCAIDFDDVLYLTLHSLRFSNPTKFCQFKWIQVDEVQDLSSLQWEIITKLINSDSHIVYFGDYDQSIYSFMGASQDSLEKNTNKAIEHVLEDNFRSPQYLIEFFNAFALANMPTRKVSKLKYNVKNKNTGGRVRLHYANGTFEDESYDIASKIIPKLATELKNIAILTRTNNDADTISSALKNNKIDHKRVSGFDLFRRRTIKDVLSFLNALANPQSRIAWTRLLSVFAGIGTLKASREMVNEVFEAGMLPTDWLINEQMKDSIDLFVQIFSSERCIIFDTETTGLSLSDDIIQIAASEVINGIPTGEIFEAYIKTNKDINESSKVHKITPEVLNTKGIIAHEAFTKFLEFVNGAPLVGHNINSFDLPMLEANLSRVNINWSRPKKIIDTLTLSKQIYPNLLSYKLAHLIEVLKLEGNNTHNAIDDVWATVSLVKQLALDGMREQEKRINIKKQYGKFIQRFVTTFTPLWNINQNELHNTVNLGRVVSEFFINAKSAVNYEIRPDELEHVETLVMYLQNHTKNKTLHHHFKNLLLDLNTFSEADLITEDVKVVVSTIHKAKGLEFEGVVLTSCIKDIYPHYYSKTTEAIKEDARLFYVGLTRAKKEIVLTSHDTVINRGGSFSRYPSPFLQFLPSVIGVKNF